MDVRVFNLNGHRMLIGTSVVGGVVAVDRSCVRAVDRSCVRAVDDVVSCIDVGDATAADHGDGGVITAGVNR